MRHAYLALALLLAGSSCVSRVLRVETEPPGATIYLDGRIAGTSPLETEFTYFGVREIIAEKDGYELARRLFEIEGAWYEAFPFDLFTEFLPLFPRTDERVIRLNLRPAARTFSASGDEAQEKASREALIERAKILRDWAPIPPKPDSP